MEALRYKVIKSEKQYNDYCTALEVLATGSDQGENTQDEIELLTYLIEKWDAEHNSFEDVDPIELLTALMSEKSLKAKDMTQILGVSKGLVSDILHYKKGLSKEIIRTLSSYFSVSQEAFNRPYKLKVSENSHFKNASVMNTRKDLQLA
ncbi:helix-turn-helix domain-containing protein [Spirosoma oryzicola]|uniref:helix-turn-helix domain-containing protein n=1 Tax=Spirosoma oryzicola TaxID=2898794 RepID=UPI001E4BC9E0|nr:transcriptional regulator [Spirosoma oryzicola]UHG94755.1 transcriptional regulator [Spirosoma oryzicola]